ncbi:Protein CBG20454 [Caenorhabditis briggsae]|uniref:Protein CBG20454 n=1 Tax=Caenorhabditis briggsae TaxID=6238 RepID=A8XXT4_CAEBR|nr:Protein CBG20454 [Caenorhabditis briggsae]CAP37453.1 Protein CBG20454 [Caenorhabditis briggsae]
MDDGSVNPQYITVGIVFIILWYFFFSIMLCLELSHTLFRIAACFIKEEEEEECTGRIETVECEIENVIDAKTKEDSEDGGKNGTSEVNHFEIVVFPKANDEEQNEATDKTETVQSDSDMSMETALGGPPGRIELVS